MRMGEGGQVEVNDGRFEDNDVAVEIVKAGEASNSPATESAVVKNSDTEIPKGIWERPPGKMLLGIIGSLASAGIIAWITLASKN
jgi:hypothetical protein